MRILTLSTLFPSGLRPHYGTFVESRLRELGSRHPVEATVVAPVPWFPSTSKVFGDYAIHAKQPAQENLNGQRVHHPKYFTLPATGKVLTPLSIATSCWLALNRMTPAEREIQLIDAHYFWPTGAAGAILARWLHKPLIVTARGSDINHFSRQMLPRRAIQWTANEAAMVITVSEALREEMIRLGADPCKVQTVSNGVDLDFFCPSPDQQKLRQSLGWSRPVVLSVGNLVDIKGHDLVIRAMTSIPDSQLLIIGSGPEQSRLEALIRELQLSDRVNLLGSIDKHSLREHYRAADILVLASSREGFANVLLESLACGCPVVATRTGGNPEIVQHDTAGMIVERDPEALAAGIRTILNNAPERLATRAYAERFGWGRSCSVLHDLMLKAVNESID